MAFKHVQITIGAAATALASTRTLALHAIIEADDGNSNAAFIGESDVDATTGVRLNNSATTPGRMEVGPVVIPFNLADIYVAGTQNEKVNVIYLER